MLLRRLAVIAVVTPLVCGCTWLSGDEADPPGNATAPAGDSEAGDPTPTAELANAEVSLPTGWQGEGILAQRTERTPRRAPPWARALAEVDTINQQRVLFTTGRAERIRNPALANSTAASRARHEMTRWTVSSTIEGSRVDQTWRDPKSGVTYARVALDVPDEWVPGQPLDALPHPEEVLE